MGILGWLKDRKRKLILAEPDPKGWDKTLRSNVAHYCVLDHGERRRLMDLVKIFVREKHWEGLGGLELTDEIKVTIAGQACLLILNLPHDYYKNVLSILIYPSTVIVPRRDLGVFEIPREPAGHDTPVLGQAFNGGPVILVWDAVLSGGRHPESGANVVYHEFAHKLDMLDGHADGTPPLRNREDYLEWIETCSREFLRLKKQAENGEPGILDRYAATNEAEFFAVATEEFFDHPHSLKKHSPALYQVLQNYYRQDPAERHGKNYCQTESADQWDK